MSVQKLVGGLAPLAITYTVLGKAIAATALFGSPGTAASTAPASSVAVAPPTTTPEIRRILTLMGDANTWGHPDLKGEFQGMQSLFKGDYQAALKDFKLGARYASKPSQAAIAMMYLNGRSVPKDEATACAWLTLAAQRKTSMYVRLQRAVCDGLSPEQHAQARQTVGDLMPIYGDQVARLRMKWKLLVSRLILFGPAVVTLGESPSPTVTLVGPRCTRLHMHLYIGIVQVPRSGCPPANSAQYWNPKQYFAAIDTRVSVGPLRVVPADAASAGEQSTAIPIDHQNATQRGDKRHP